MCGHYKYQPTSDVKLYVNNIKNFYQIISADVTLYVSGHLEGEPLLDVGEVVLVLRL